MNYDPVFKTDIFSTMRADFGDFELSFYLSTQMANRQLMVFHGDAGFIEVHAPFNASLYDHDHITLHNRSHDGAQVFRFPGIHQYALEAEAFVRAAEGRKAEAVHAGRIDFQPEADRRHFQGGQDWQLGKRVRQDCGGFALGDEGKIT